MSQTGLPGIVEISTRAWRDSYATVCCEVVADHQGLIGKFRLRIQATSPIWDSYAIAEKWSGREWKEVHRIAAQTMRCAKKHQPDGDPSMSFFKDDLRELWMVAARVAAPTERRL